MKGKNNFKIAFKISFIILLFASVYLNRLLAQEIFVANWNLENLFDTVDDPGKNDEEFTPKGSKHWTEARLNVKLQHLAQVINLMNNGKGPDLLGVEEVEHKALLQKLLTLVKTDKNYGIAYAESPDKRGIDNGLIFNKNFFRIIFVKAVKVELPSRYPTRFILEVKLLAKNGAKIYLFVNHWPSRRGGLHKSRPNRIAAARKLLSLIKSVLKDEPNSFVIALGDFNDEPTNFSIKKILNAKLLDCNKTEKSSELYDLAYKLKIKGLGSYLYRKHWNMLDQIIVNKNVILNNSFNYECDSFGIFKPLFVIEKYGRYKGAILPTFGGRKYLAGYSDHYPVYAKFIIK